MSKENVMLFFEKVNKDFQLQKQIDQLSDATEEEFIEEVINLGRKNGYEFNAEDMKKVAVEAIVSLLEKAQLSEQDYKMVFDEFFEDVEVTDELVNEYWEKFNEKDEWELLH